MSRDFDAPRPAPKDTSAAMIAVCAYLKIYEYTNETSYLDRALYLLKSAIKFSLSGPATFVTPTSDNLNGDVEVDFGESAETILLKSTINNNEFANRRLADHGLVYADYYFILAGNMLLKLGLIK